MNWIAPSEKDTDNAALEKRLWDAADQFRANSGFKAQGHKAVKAGLLFLLVVSSLPFAGAAPTIDWMVTTDYTYHPTYYPEQRLLLPMQTPRYYLSDGTSWPSGAGSARIPRVTFQSSFVADGFIYYRFSPPEESIIFRVTDYSFGDHSSQGTLGFSDEFVLVAAVGSRVATFSNTAIVLDNTPTAAAEFNYFSASVGESVFVSIGLTNRSGAWQSDSFLQSFEYSGSGLVDFTQIVPEPTPLVLILGAGVWAIFSRSPRNVADSRSTN